MTDFGVEMNVFGDVDDLGGRSSRLGGVVDVIWACCLIEPKLRDELGSLLPVILGVGRAKKNRFQDLLRRDAVANSVLPGSTLSTACLDNIAEIDSLGWNLTVDSATRAEEANAFSFGSFTDDTLLCNEVKLCAIEGKDRRHLRSALGDGDSLRAHFDGEKKTREGKRKTREGELQRQNMREGR